MGRSLIIVANLAILLVIVVVVLLVWRNAATIPPWLIGAQGALVASINVALGALAGSRSTRKS